MKTFTSMFSSLMRFRSLKPAARPSSDAQPQASSPNAITLCQDGKTFRLPDNEYAVVLSNFPLAQIATDMVLIGIVTGTMLSSVGFLVQVPNATPVTFDDPDASVPALEVLTHGELHVSGIDLEQFERMLDMNFLEPHTRSGFHRAVELIFILYVLHKYYPSSPRFRPHYDHSAAQVLLAQDPDDALEVLEIVIGPSSELEREKILMVAEANRKARAHSRKQMGQIALRAIRPQLSAGAYKALCELMG